MVAIRSKLFRGAAVSCRGVPAPCCTLLPLEYLTVIGLLVFFQPTPNSSAAFPSALWCRWINFKLCHWRGAPLCSSVSVPTHPVCNIKCKSSLHWYPLSIQTNTKYKSLRLNMQGSRRKPSYYSTHLVTEVGRCLWDVTESGSRERKCPQCVLDNTNVRLSPPGPRSTIEWWPAAGALLLLNMATN